MSITSKSGKRKSKPLIDRLTCRQENNLIAAYKARQSGSVWMPQGNNFYTARTIEALRREDLVVVKEDTLFMLTPKGEAIASLLLQRRSGGKES